MSSGLRLRFAATEHVDKTDGSPEPYLGLEGIVSGVGRLVDSDLPLKEATDSVRFRQGDVLFGKLRPYLAKSWYATRDGSATGELLVMRPGPPIEGRYLKYLTLSRPWLDWAGISAYGAKMPRTSWEAMRDFRLPEIPREAQRRIVDFLDRETAQIDAMIDKQEELIALLEERLLTAIDHVVWEGRFEAHRVPGPIGPRVQVPESWRVTRNKYVLREREDTSVGGEEEMLSVSHLTGVTPRSEKSVTMFEAESNVGYRLVAPGDFVINTMWAWMGALGVSRHHGIVSPAYGVYSVLDGAQVDPTYLHYLYRSRPYVAEMTRYSRGVWSSRLRLYPDVFLSLPVVLPPPDEQRTIVEYLQQQEARVTRIRRKAEASIELMRERRAALISDAVTGRLDVESYGRGAA